MNLRAIFFLLFLSSVSIISAQTIRVKKRSVSSLQNAFENVQPGQIIRIPEGKYFLPEGIIMEGKSNVKIQGEGLVEFIAGDPYSGVMSLYDCRNVEIQNIQMRHDRPVDGSLCSGPVLSLYRCDSTLVRSCDLNGCGQIALQGQEVSGLKLIDNRMHNNSVCALAIRSVDGNSLHHVNGNDLPEWIEAEGNEIWNNGDMQYRMQSYFELYPGLEWEEQAPFIRQNSKKVKEFGSGEENDGEKIYAEGVMEGAFLGVEWGDFAHLSMGVEGRNVSFFVGPVGNLSEFEDDPYLLGKNIRVKWREMDMDLREFSGSIERHFQITEIRLLKD